MKKEDTATTIKPQNGKEESPVCGIVMPISSIDGLHSDHWAEILGIIKDVCNDNGFEGKLVSEAQESSVIQGRIIQNLYSNDMVICDVSAKNPNVMFELGMRLAFNKPAIIMKDNLTDYSFDTGIIEHIVYPRDLRFNAINKFKTALGSKLKSTYEKSKDADYVSFLKNFGEYKVQHLDQKNVSVDNYLLGQIEAIAKDLNILKNQTRHANDQFYINESNILFRGKTTGEKMLVEEVKSIIQNAVKTSSKMPSQQEIVSEILTSEKPISLMYAPSMLKKLVAEICDSIAF
ncbi:MAG: hypothetical protein IPO83_00035 [Chitinophagaceae bacterium]|nr:hypothetical protein [Chitinophagaceae bacterium]